MAREQEIKLAVADADRDRIGGWLLASGAQPLPTEKLINTYFDTPAADLNRERAALRIRQSGARYVQTLKTKGAVSGGIHDRQEWDWPLEEPRLDLEALKHSPVSGLLDLTTLQPAFTTDFIRDAWLWHASDTVIEIAVDRGEIRSGDWCTAISEIELELKAGTTAALMKQAEALSRICPVFLNPVSKAERGYFIAGLYRPAPVRSRSEKNPENSEKNLDDWLTAMGHFALTGNDDYLRQALAAVERLGGVCRSGKKLPPEQWSLMRQAHTELSAGTPDEVIAQLLDKPIIGRCQLALVSP